MVKKPRMIRFFLEIANIFLGERSAFAFVDLAAIVRQNSGTKVQKKEWGHGINTSQIYPLSCLILIEKAAKISVVIGLNQLKIA